MSQKTASPSGYEDGSVVVILDCDVAQHEGFPEGWTEGPLPLSENVLERDVVSDRASRATFFSPNVTTLLYGRSGLEALSLRLHRALTEPLFHGEFRIVACELIKVLQSVTVRNRDHQVAQLIVHVVLPSRPWKDLMVELHQSFRTPEGRTTWLAFLTDLLPPEIRLPIPGSDPETPNGSAASDRFFTILKTEVGHSPGASPNEMLELATLTPDTVNPPSASLLGFARDDTFHPSDDWAFLVRRDGVGIQSRGREPFSTELDFYCRTIYADLFALARIQSRVLREISARLVEIVLDSNFSVRDVQEFDREVAIFRSAYNWSTISPSHVANAMLNAYHAQFGFSEKFTDVSSDLAALSTAASLEAANSAERASRQTNGMLSALAVFGVPLSLAMTLWQSANGGVLEFIIAVASAASLSFLALLSVPGLRAVIRDIRGKDFRHAERARQK